MKHSGRGRQDVLSIFASGVLTSGNAKISRADKRYMIAGKLVDLLIEPTLYARGINAYEQGRNIVAMDMLWKRGATACGEEAWAELERAFMALARSEKGEPFDRYVAALSKARAVSQEPLISALLDLFADERAVVLNELGLPGRVHGPSTDPAVTMLVALLQYWSYELPRLRAVHDQSATVLQNKATLEALNDPAGAQREVDLGAGRTMLMPGNAEEIELRDSRSSVQLQVADILAGAAAHWSMRGRGGDRFARELEEVGVPELIVHELWPPGGMATPRLW